MEGKGRNREGSLVAQAIYRLHCRSGEPRRKDRGENANAKGNDADDEIIFRINSYR